MYSAHLSLIPSPSAATTRDCLFASCPTWAIGVIKRYFSFLGRELAHLSSCLLWESCTPQKGGYADFHSLLGSVLQNMCHSVAFDTYRSLRNAPCVLKEPSTDLFSIYGQRRGAHLRICEPMCMRNTKFSLWSYPTDTDVTVTMCAKWRILSRAHI